MSKAPIALLVLGCVLLVSVIIFSQFTDVIVAQQLTGVANDTAYNIINLVWSGLGLAGIACIVAAAVMVLSALGWIG